MEIQGKENFMALHKNPFETQDLKRLTKLLPETQLNKPKAKTTKATATNIREGDWICLICNNFNFSFRDECNRCQIQTKKSNLIQGLQLATEGQKLNTNERVPLRDLTNQKQPPNSHLLQNFALQIQKEHNFDIAKERNLATRQLSDLFDGDNKDSFDFFSNYGFGNALLLTPPRALKKVELPTSYEKELPAYRSPKELPSVSPILKKLILNGFEKNGQKQRMSSKVKLNFADQKETTDTQGKSQNSLDSFIEKKGFLEEKYRQDGEFDLNLNHLITEDEENNSLKFLKDLEKYIQKPMNLPPGMNEEDPQRKEKKGKHDWVCPNCKNFNYSFRKSCNRCQLSR